MKFAFIALALLLFLPAMASAQPMPSICEQSSVANYWNLRFGNWQDICVLGLLISFLLVSLLYMASHAFGNAELTAWCKKELFQVFLTCILVGSIFWFVNLMCAFVSPSMFVELNPGDCDHDGLTVPLEQCNLFDYSINYLIWLRNAAYTLYNMLAVVGGFLAGKAEITVLQSPGGYGFNTRPFGGLSGMVNNLSFSMSTTLVGGLLTTIAQLRMLRAVQLMMFNIILPIGVFCRCFEPTRRFGGSLIAIAIGLFIFYPILLTINAGAVRGSILSEGFFLVAQNKIVQQEGAYPEGTRIDYLDQAYQQTVNPDDEAYDPTGGSEGASYTSLSSNNIIFQIFFTLTIRLLIAALFLPLLNFILLISFIRNLSRFLGEEVDITNITRMI
jgi:hypothetical protein